MSSKHSGQGFDVADSLPSGPKDRHLKRLRSVQKGRKDCGNGHRRSSHRGQLSSVQNGLWSEGIGVKEQVQGLNAGQLTGRIVRRYGGDLDAGVRGPFRWHDQELTALQPDDSSWRVC